MAFGLEMATITAPDLRTLGVPGEAFFTSLFDVDIGTFGPSSEGLLVGGLVTPTVSSFFHLNEKEGVRITPFGCAVLPS